MKKFLALLLIPAMLLGVSFKDLNPKHWAYEAVVKLAEMGIITGYPDGTFRGKEPVSRYQLAMALYRLVKYIDERVAASPSPSSETGTVDRRLEVKIASLEKLVSDLRRRVAILEKGRGEEGTAGEEVANLESMIKKAFELISKNTASLKDLESSIESLEKVQDGLQGELAEMKTRIEEIKKDLNSLSGGLRKIEDLEGEIRSLKNAVAVLGADLKEYVDEKMKELLGSGGSADVDYLKTVVNANVESIEDIKKDIEELKKAIARIEESKSGVSVEDLEKVKERVSKIEEKFQRISDLNERVGELEKRVSDIEKSVESMKEASSAISSMKADMKDLSSEISRIHSKIDEFKKNLNTIASGQKDHEKRIKELESKIEDLESESAAVKENVEGLKEKTSGIPGWGMFMIFLGIVNLAIGGYALYAVLTSGS